MNTATLDLDTAVKNALAAARGHAASNPEGADWFPCGFAWVAFRCRKNAKESKTLIANGFRWDDYRKSYLFSAPTRSQSMRYNEAVAQVAVDYLAQNGFDGFRVESWID